MKKLFPFLLLLAALVLLCSAGSAEGYCPDGTHKLQVAEVVPPTCDTSGYNVMKCENCPHTFQVVTEPARDHKWVCWDQLDATCEEKGYKKYACEYCDARREDVLSALGHDWLEQGAIAPDCENPGKELGICQTCGKLWEYVRPALGHDWQRIDTIRAATCESRGLKEVECTVCGKREEQTIPATGHDWVNTTVLKEPTCTKEGKTEAECRDCGKTTTLPLDKVPHSYGEWAILKKATETAKGTRTRTCEVCGHKDKESYEFEESYIAVQTSAGKVNLRSGPSTGKKRVANVAKKGTYLGQLRESAVDGKGEVWYKLKYKSHVCWVMAKYAALEISDFDPEAERLPEKTGKELSNYFLMSFSAAEDALSLEELSGEDDYLLQYGNDALTMSGVYYAETIELTGEGYTVYGVKVGERIKDALKKLKEKELLPEAEYEDEYVWRIPCSPYALAVDEDGLCGTLTILLDTNSRIECITLEADTPDDW